MQWPSGSQQNERVGEWIVANNVVRKNDLASGHGCFPPHRIIGGSPTVFVNKRNVIRQGDLCEPHSCGLVINSHYSYTETKDDWGTRTVFINGTPATRLGDTMSVGVEKKKTGISSETHEEVNCESIVITASSNVFFGE